MLTGMAVRGLRLCTQVSVCGYTQTSVRMLSQMLTQSHWTIIVIRTNKTFLRGFCFLPYLTSCPDFSQDEINLFLPELFSVFYHSRKATRTVTGDSFELLILQSPPLERWDYRLAPPCPVSLMLGLKPRAPFMLDKHFTNRTTSSAQSLL